jgi:hypothetical protein
LYETLSVALNGPRWFLRAALQEIFPVGLNNNVELRLVLHVLRYNDLIKYDRY